LRFGFALSSYFTRFASVGQGGVSVFRDAANGEKIGASPAFSRFDVGGKAAEGRAAQKKSVRERWANVANAL